jgi:hypothetical protein
MNMLVTTQQELIPAQVKSSENLILSPVSIKGNILTVRPLPENSTTAMALTARPYTFFTENSQESQTPVKRA